jgi:hypothetical protein
MLPLSSHDVMKPLGTLQAIKILNMIKLFGKAIRVNKASQDKDTLDVGANLFIGNLDPDVDEKVCRRSVVDVTHSSLLSVHIALVAHSTEPHTAHLLPYIL